MTIRRALFVLAVPDLSRSSAFYHSYFGYLVVDDADGYYQRVRSAGAEIIKPLTTETWGMREFGLRTVDGHRIMIGQDLKGE
ncbi:MAG: hypothetical protein DME08_22755 [Candidatus Rokuibacteriota bacterium]|nr:MAG: hypothetical protein DME08_22755 [Candidatus Rokubacteria bacterium]